MAQPDLAIGAGLTEEAAATMVQAIVRGGSERKVRQKEVKAATTVQAHLKGRSLRRSMTASNVRAVSSRVSFTAADSSSRKPSMPKSLTRGKTLSGLFAGGNLAASKVAPIDRKPPSCSQRLSDNWGLFKGMAHLRLLLVILWAAVVVAIKEHLVDEFTEDEDEVFGLLSSPASRSGVGVLGSLLAFALVFRTSICYARWWEARRLPSPGLPVPTRAASATPPQPPSPRTCPHTARTPPLPRLPPSACAAQARCLWGLMIYAAINLAQQTNCWMHEGSPELASRASCMLMVFVNACATHLRNTSLDKGPDTRRLVNEGILEELELQIICTQPGWQPYYALDVLRSVPALARRPTPHAPRPSTPAPHTCPARALSNQTRRPRLPYQVTAKAYSTPGCLPPNWSEATKAAAFERMENTIDDLAKAIGGCIRIKATGLPYSYDSFLNLLLDFFYFLATIAYASMMCVAPPTWASPRPTHASPPPWHSLCVRLAHERRAGGSSSSTGAGTRPSSWGSSAR